MFSIHIGFMDEAYYTVVRRSATREGIVNQKKVWYKTDVQCRKM